MAKPALSKVVLGEGLLYFDSWEPYFAEDRIRRWAFVRKKNFESAGSKKF